MIPHVSKFGIYFSSKERKVVRITSPYWFPEKPEWVYLTNEVNATLVSIRQILRDRSLLDDPHTVTWGRIPLKE